MNISGGENLFLYKHKQCERKRKKTANHSVCKICLAVFKVNKMTCWSLSDLSRDIFPFLGAMKIYFSFSCMCYCSACALHCLTARVTSDRYDLFTPQNPRPLSQTSAPRTCSDSDGARMLTGVMIALWFGSGLWTEVCRLRPFVLCKEGKKSPSSRLRIDRAYRHVQQQCRSFSVQLHHKY